MSAWAGTAPAVGASALVRLLRAGRWTLLHHPVLSPFQQLGAAWIVRTCWRHGGALLYDAPGLGKTRTALIAAQALGGRIEVIAPAVVLGRWREELARTEVDATLVSDGLLSRGTAPACEADVVIVDEAHRFATAGTRRSEALADRVAGRTVVLLTATPARNRPAELVTLVELFAPLSSLVECGAGPAYSAAQIAAALGQVGLGRSREDALALDARVGAGRSGLRLPEVASHTLQGLCWADEELDRIGQIAELLVPLRGEPRVLYRQLVWRALSSSPQAAAATLWRGCAFARRWLEAAASGRTLDRSEYRTLLSESTEQLVFAFWYREGGAETGFDVEAVYRAEALAAELAERPCATGATLEALAALDGAAVLFAERRETVDAYAAALRSRRLVVRVHGGAAWLPGLGRTSVDDALAWFVAASRAGRMPLLVSTPVLSEGLDLQCASAVVHLDVAWNPARMAQREGRVVRPGGSLQARLMRIGVADTLEARCRAEWILETKGALPAGQARSSPISAVLATSFGCVGGRCSGRLSFFVTRGRTPGWVFAFAGGGLVVSGAIRADELADALRVARRRRRVPYWMRLRMGRRRQPPSSSEASTLGAATAFAERLVASGASACAGALVRDVTATLGPALPRGMARLRAAHCRTTPQGEGATWVDWRQWLAAAPADRKRGRARLVLAMRVMGERCFT